MIKTCILIKTIFFPKYAIIISSVRPQSFPKYILCFKEIQISIQQSREREREDRTKLKIIQMQSNYIGY